MGFLSVKTVQRGRNLKVTVTAVVQSNSFDRQSNPISVDDLADVIVRLHSVPHKVGALNVCLKMKMKKDSNVKVPLKVSCEEFDEQFFCSGKWIEAEIKNIQCEFNTYCEKDNCGAGIYYYNFEINIFNNVELFMEYRELYKDNDFTDFQLQTRDETVSVHKSVLAIHSDMTRKILRGGSSEDQKKEITESCIKFDGVTVKTLQNLKKFMYLGQLPDEGLEPLLLIAIQYQMKDLRRTCISELIKSVKPENYDSIVKFAIENKIPELVKSLVFDISNYKSQLIKE